MPEVGVARLLSVLNSFDLADQAFRALVADQGEDGRIDILVLALAHFSEFQDALVRLLVLGRESPYFVPVGSLVHDQVVVSAVVEHVDAFLEALFMAE